MSNRPDHPASNQPSAPPSSLSSPDATGAVLYAGEPATVPLAAGTGHSLVMPRWGLLDVLVAFVGSIALSVLLAVAVGLVSGQPLTVATTPGLAVLSLVLPWLAIAGWPLFASMTRGNGPRIDYGFTFRGVDLVWGVTGGIIAVIIAGLIGWITTLIQGDFTSAAGDLADQLADSRIWFALVLLAIAVGAPIVEEILFRGLLWNAVAKRGLSPWIATVTSALAFSLFHFELVRFPLLLATGLVLGYLRQRTGSITTPIVAHMVNNLIGVIGLLTSL